MPQTLYWPQQYYGSAATTIATTYNTGYDLHRYCNQSYTMTGTQSVWQNWNTSITAQTTYTDQAWVQWNQTLYPRQPSYTPEQRAEMEAQRERQRIITDERVQRRVAARTRARLLLEQFLDDEQKAELEHHGRFFVTGSRGRRYCIRASGQSGNVDLLKPDGSVQARLCCHPRRAPGESLDLLPEGDAWLMQMIEIRHDEDHFLRTANVHRGVLPVAV